VAVAELAACIWVCRLHQRTPLALHRCQLPARPTPHRRRHPRTAPPPRHAAAPDPRSRRTRRLGGRRNRHRRDQLPLGTPTTNPTTRRSKQRMTLAQRNLKPSSPTNSATVSCPFLGLGGGLGS
jgi:hypothetical protein